MSAFPLQISWGGKTPNPCTNPSMRILFYPGQDPACGGLETLSECGSEHFFFASCQNSTLLLCHKWKNICAGSKMNKYGNWVWPWVRVAAVLGWGEPCLVLGGSSGGYPLSMGALPFTAQKVVSTSDISINCPQTFEVGLASAPFYRWWNRGTSTDLTSPCCLTQQAHSDIPRVVYEFIPWPKERRIHPTTRNAFLLGWQERRSERGLGVSGEQIWSGAAPRTDVSSDVLVSV